MGVYFASRSQSAEDQIWDHLDRMRDAGPVADSYLAAHERQVWAIGTGRAVADQVQHGHHHRSGLSAQDRDASDDSRPLARGDITRAKRR